MSRAGRRYLIISLSRLASALLAGLGVVLLGRATGLPQQIAAAAIVIGGMGMMMFIPRALAARWATPKEP